MNFIIHYQDPNSRLVGETKSKLLSNTSDLYNFLQKTRDKLVIDYPERIALKRMDFHTELITQEDVKNIDIDSTLISRCQELEGKMINLDFDILGENAFILNTPAVSGYGNTHITIAYFKEGVPYFLKKQVEEFRNQKLSSLSYQ